MIDSNNPGVPGVPDQKVVAPEIIKEGGKAAENLNVNSERKQTADEETDSTPRKVEKQGEKKQSSSNACWYWLVIGIIIAIFVISISALFAYKYMTPTETVYVEVQVEPEPHPSLVEATRMEHMYNELIVMDFPARNQKFPTRKVLKGLT